MSEIRFKFDWLDPQGIRGPELRATWARFEMWVDDHPVTRVSDEVSKTTRDSVFVPLYPLAEWLATHWWQILYEIPSSRREETSGAARHSFRAAREGYALPAVSIESRGESIEVSWSREELPHCRLEFLNGDRRFVTRSELERKVSSFISAVLGRLEDSGVAGTLLQQEWAAISGTDPEEEKFCSAAAALGLDPYDLTEIEAGAIEEAGDLLPVSLRTEFFSSAELSRLKDEAEELVEAVGLGSSNSADLRPLKTLRSELTNLQQGAGADQPWRAGYELARRVRSLLSLDGQPLARLNQALGVSREDLDRAVREQASRTKLFDAVVGINDRESPGFVLSSSGERAKRFHLCRGLFEYLTSPTPQPALLTRTNSDRQRRSRAFAAELLAPSSWLRARIKSRRVDPEEVEELANEFGVSEQVITHQIENHRIAALSEL